jgi:hypothetical protein
MSGKDLLAVLAMIVPSLTLIAAIAFGIGLSTAENAVKKGPDPSTRDKQQIATQKRMRDPWEARDLTKSASAPVDDYCDASLSNGKFSCSYW